MGALNNIKGKTFGQWYVVRRSTIKSKNAKWVCICINCSTEKIVIGFTLMNGASKSCGCMGTNNTHNMTHTPTYKTWQMMRQRCENKNAPDFHRYGGRGIKVCSRWASFENFYNDMGVRPNDRTLDRINNNGNYESDNCKWATSFEQHQNMSSTKIKRYEWATIKSLRSSGLKLKEIATMYGVCVSRICVIVNS